MKTLKDLREEIDSIDDAFLDLIAKRRDMVMQVGETKKTTAAPIRDTEREHEKLSHLVAKGKSLGIPEQVILTIWKTFFADAYEIEK